MDPAAKKIWAVLFGDSQRLWFRYRLGVRGRSSANYGGYAGLKIDCQRGVRIYVVRAPDGYTVALGTVVDGDFVLDREVTGVAERGLVEAVAALAGVAS